MPEKKKGFEASAPAVSQGLFGAPPAAPAGPLDVKEAYKERMIKIYQQHNPSKVRLDCSIC